ncbi:hypothetical protein JCM11641_004606 [Rhodosporidiobolus odoratus]
MAAATPSRRPSYAPSLSASELTSPPPSFPRRVSTVSSVGTTSPSLASSVHGQNGKRKRLRDYYGLKSTTGRAEELDIDSTAYFTPEAYFTHLAETKSLPELLRRENELLNEIRELDGERQSLVYNHHHELIDASDTIRQMKSRAEALDTSLDSLKTSFESISQLSASLSSLSSLPSLARCSSSTLLSARPMVASPSAISPATITGAEAADTPTTPTRLTFSKLSTTSIPDSPTTPTATRGRSTTLTLLSPQPPPALAFDPLVHLPTLLSLPILLRSLLDAGDENGKQKAEGLWGTWEPALRSWEDEGVMGVREVGMECREVLRAWRG